MTSKISQVNFFTNTERLPRLAHMNVIVNILYLHILKITVCSVVDCSFISTFKAKPKIWCLKKKQNCATLLKRKQLRHVYAAQYIGRVRRAKVSSLFLKFNMNKRKRITLLQLRPHVLWQRDSVYLFVSNVNILDKLIHFSESVLIFVQPSSERERTQSSNVMTDFNRFSAL